MSILEAVYDRRISNLLSKCLPILANTLLDRIYNSKLKIPDVLRLNYYLKINNINYEIYGIKKNKLIDYIIADQPNNIDPKVINKYKMILSTSNLPEYNIYVYNTKLIHVSNLNIIRFENTKRSRSEFDDDSNYQRMVKDNFNYKVDQTWVSASKTRNSALNDRCMDYYDEYNILNFEDTPVKRNPNMKRMRRELGDFVQQKFKDGIEFENKIIKQLFEKYSDKIVKIGESYMARDKDICLKTFNSMYRGVPLIYQGVVQNPENQTLGSVDLLVRDDYINEITNNKYELEKLESEFPHKHFYYAVDIKNSKLQLNVDNTTIRNSLSVKPFKFQLHVYNEALKHMQKVNTSKAFIMGKGWKMERSINKQKIIQESNDFDDKLGTIDFNKTDDFIMTETDSSIKWLHELNKSTDWTHRPPSNKHIYPNMCNTNDDGYRNIKSKSAEELKDITLISYLTPEHREIAFKNGIKSWDNPSLTSELLGINGKIGELVDAILSTNRDQSSKIVFYKTLVNEDGVLDSKRLEYYIDFETIVHNNYNYVYMIGLGYVFSSEWNYKCFTLDDLSEDSERKMYDELLTYIDNINRKYKVNYQPLYYHWSSVEPNQLNKLISNLKLPLNDIKWFDLYKYFRDNVITVKGSYGFSLKSVGKGLYKNKLINTYWNEGILGDNKISSLAYKRYVEKIKMREFNDLVKYNEVDCKIMYDILRVVRKSVELV